MTVSVYSFVYCVVIVLTHYIYAVKGDLEAVLTDDGNTTEALKLLKEELACYQQQQDSSFFRSRIAPSLLTCLPQQDIMNLFCF